jgi:hypothetical protein
MTIISNAKEIADLIKKIGDVELYRKIVELEGEIIEFTRKNRELEEEIQNLKAQLKINKDLIWESPYYWLPKDDGAKDGPYCQKCWDDDKKLIRLQKKIKGSWNCDKCKNHFTDSDYSPQHYRTSRA